MERKTVENAGINFSIVLPWFYIFKNGYQREIRISMELLF